MDMSVKRKNLQFKHQIILSRLVQMNFFYHPSPIERTKLRLRVVIAAIVVFLVIVVEVELVRTVLLLPLVVVEKPEMRICL